MRREKVVWTLKMMYAATPEQEHYMQYLLNYFYTDVFPYYFDDEQIRQFEEWGILSLDHEHVAYNGTMKEAFPNHFGAAVAHYRHRIYGGTWRVRPI